MSTYRAGVLVKLAVQRNAGLTRYALGHHLLD
jgi:hypothetical protein